jgi:hypothetical protein
MRARRVLATAGFVALALSTVACHSKPTASSTASSGTASATSPATPAAGPAVASASGSVTFDGAYKGSVTSVTCIGSGPSTTAHFNVTFSGDSGTSYTGDLSASEFGFRAPDGTDFDSGFLSKPLGTDGKRFVLDGIVVKDQQSGKSVTTHGTLACP